MARLRRTAALALVVVALTACSAAPRVTNGPSAPARTIAPATQPTIPAPSQIVPSLGASDAPTEPPPATDPPVVTEPPVATEPPTTAPNPTPGLTEPFPYGEFDDPTTIDNQWLPLSPGLRWQWEGETLDPDTGETQPHRIVMVVTALTKVIDGVTTRVAWDRDFADGELVEQEIIFLAQDDSGTVWHLGQYPEEYEEGEFVDAPGWIAGVVGSQAGIWMPANPRVGDPSYSQGWGPVVGWTDRGLVIEEGLTDCVVFGCFDDVIVIEEWALDHPDARQTKYYAPGIGNIRVGWSGSPDQEQEELELIVHETVTADQLARANETALELEARAYEILAHIYGDTEPMQLPN